MSFFIISSLFFFLSICDFRINNECVKNREARISIDLVKDEVENSLEREVENIKTYQQRMQKMLAKVQRELRGYIDFYVLSYLR